MDTKDAVSFEGRDAMMRFVFQMLEQVCKKIYGRAMSRQRHSEGHFVGNVRKLLFFFFLLRCSYVGEQ